MTRPWTYVVLVLALLVSSGANAPLRVDPEQREECATHGPRALLKAATRSDSGMCPRNAGIDHEAVRPPGGVGSQPDRPAWRDETDLHADPYAASSAAACGARAPPPV